MNAIGNCILMVDAGRCAMVMVATMVIGVVAMGDDGDGLSVDNSRTARMMLATITAM